MGMDNPGIEVSPIAFLKVYLNEMGNRPVD